MNRKPGPRARALATARRWFEEPDRDRLSVAEWAHIYGLVPRTLERYLRVAREEGAIPPESRQGRRPDRRIEVPDVPTSSNSNSSQRWDFLR